MAMQTQPRQDIDGQSSMCVIPTALFDTVSHTDIIIYAVLSSFWRRNGYNYEEPKVIAKLARVSKKRLEVGIQRLIEVGAVTKDEEGIRVVYPYYG